MSALAAALMIMLIATVAAIVLSPLGAFRKERPLHEDELSGLEAEREAKYREIRDTELDYRLGKHTERDFQEINASLRGEALKILNRIETLEAAEAETSEDVDEAGEEDEADDAAAEGR